jgi:gamma-glutamyltranspeptidase/glutathione hydrolase
VISVVDGLGNVFAATPSDASIDGPVVPGLGFVISTRGGQSHTEQDHPATVAPNKRPRITACPIMFEDSCGRILAGGGPGGDMQLQAMAQVLGRHLGRGEPLKDAVSAPRVYTQSGPSSSSPHLSFPGRVSAEDGIPQDVVAALTDRDHHIVAATPAGINRASVCLVSSGPAKSDRQAVGDPRRGSGQRVGNMAGRQP